MTGPVLVSSQMSPHELQPLWLEVNVLAEERSPLFFHCGKFSLPWSQLTRHFKSWMVTWMAKWIKMPLSGIERYSCSRVAIVVCDEVVTRTLKQWPSCNLHSGILGGTSRLIWVRIAIVRGEFNLGHLQHSVLCLERIWEYTHRTCSQSATDRSET